MRNAAAIPALALLTGCGLGLLLPDLPVLPGVILLIAALIAAALASWREMPRAIVASVAAGFFVGGAVLAVTAWRHAWQPSLRVVFEEIARSQRADAEAEHRALPLDEEAFATVEGSLRQDAAAAEWGALLSVAVDAVCQPAGCVHVDGGIAATVVGTLAAERVASWRAGRRVRMPIQLRRPARYLDPGVPDHERALARRGTILAGTVKSGALVEVVARGTPLDEAMSAVRAFSRRAIAQAVGRWSERSAGIVTAIVIGDRVGLQDDVQRALQEAGTYHVIAISGGNIAILAGLLLGAFRLAGSLGRAAMAGAIAVLIAYADLVGGGASVDRATLMAVVYFAARAFDQRTRPVNTLAVVAALLVATDPLSVVDPAFVLTFGATLAIVIVVPAAQWHAGVRADAGHGSIRNIASGVVRAIVSMLTASVAAEAMLLPVGALIFSRVTFAGLALNLLAIPLMAVAQLAGMALVPAALVSAHLALGLGFVAHVGADGLVRSAELVKYAPAVSCRVATPAWWAVAAYYGFGATGVVLAFRRRHRTGSSEASWVGWTRRAAGLGAVAAAAWIVCEPWTYWTNHGDGALHVTFIDVGQGDSAFVRFPHGATLLVDAGGIPGSSFDIGERVVAPVLRVAGVRRLDALALTHGDPDHVGGATSIVREFRPRQVWEGVPVPRSELLAAVHRAADEAGAEWRTVRAGEHFSIDEVDVTVRHPPLPDWERQRVRNDDSIVLELRWRDASVLLTGDIGKAVERTIGPDLRPSPLRVVKVAHHGSLTSSSVDFVRALAPRAAVFSVGRANHFGHPAPEVLQRYVDADVEIFRTDRDGAVTLDSDGYSLRMRTFDSGDRELPRKHEDTKKTHEDTKEVP